MERYIWYTFIEHKIMINIREEVVAAETRIRDFIRQTPLDESFHLSKIANCQAFLKLENLQHTGSFKVRGAMNKLLSLDPREREAGVVAASTGNHGLAVAYGLKRLSVPGTIFLPENASPQKVRRLRNYDVHIQFTGRECEETEIYSREFAQKSGQVYISPYNDPQIIGGQGTVAMELINQLESVDSILLAVGGGGLISGVAGFLKETGKEVEIIGCVPQNSSVMADSVRAGHIVHTPVRPTLSDGTAGGIEDGSITFEPCKKYVDDWVLVTEDEIQNGMRLIFEQHGYVVEGAASVVAASFLKLKDRFEGKHVVLVMCGGNIDIDKFKALVF